MCPARAKAKQAQAMAETAASLADVHPRLERIEAAQAKTVADLAEILAEILALLKAEPAAPKPTTPRKDK